MRTKWDMQFADRADKALKLMEDSTFDVIVTDMRMPDMDGAALLECVQIRYPMVVRIILSGFSDLESVMKSVKSAHQYLAKPCEKTTLINAVTMACRLRDKVACEPIKKLLGGINTVPSPPAIYAEIIAALKSGDASSAGIGQIISRDVGMSAKILQLINSSFFGTGRRVADPEEAVVVLGIDMVKTLVLAVEVFSRFERRTLAVLPIEKINEHCLVTGVIAGQIARAEKLGKETMDDAVVSGLLHDIGKMILAAYYPEEYRGVIKLVKTEKIMVHEAEIQVFSVSHAEVGGYLLSLWGLPDDIVSGVAFHHSPDQAGRDRFNVCGIIHVADLMEKHERVMPGQWETLTGVDTQYLDRLNLTNRIPLWRDNLRIR